MIFSLCSVENTDGWEDVIQLNKKEITFNRSRGVAQLTTQGTFLIMPI